MTVTTREMTRSYGGRLYEGGTKVGGAQSFTLTRGTSTTSIGVLDQKQEILVEDSVTYTLELTEVILDSSWSRRILEADVAGQQLTFLFIAEIDRNDGQRERVRMDGAVINGDFILAYLERGSARTRDLTFQLDQIPQILQSIV